MEELQLLIQMVSNLPSMALWVLVGFWAYKVIVIGSVYGVIRFAIKSFVEWRKQPITYDIYGLRVDKDTQLQIIAELTRLSGPGGYFSRKDLTRLHDAIDSKIEKENFEEKKC